LVEIIKKGSNDEERGHWQFPSIDEMRKGLKLKRKKRRAAKKIIKLQIITFFFFPFAIIMQTASKPRVPKPTIPYSCISSSSHHLSLR